MALGASALNCQRLCDEFRDVCPAFGMCGKNFREAGESQHCICIELFQPHHVQYWFSPRAPRLSSRPLVRTAGVTSTIEAGYDRRRSARGSLRQLPCGLPAGGGRGPPKMLRSARFWIQKQPINRLLGLQSPRSRVSPIKCVLYSPPRKRPRGQPIPSRFLSRGHCPIHASAVVPKRLRRKKQPGRVRGGRGSGSFRCRSSATENGRCQTRRCPWL